MFKSPLLAIRPKTLTASVVPVVVTVACVYAMNGELRVGIALYALLGAICIQIATNLFNDAIDFKKGADTEERVGPKRVTQSGLLSSKQVMLLALMFCLLAVLFGVPLVLRGGLPIVLIGVVSLLMAYSYTGGPFPLAYLGLGDLFVILFFGLIAVGGVYYLLLLQWGLPALVAGLQVGMTSTVLIAINNARDIEQDRKVNKKTLAVRFGLNFVRREVALLYLSTFLLGGYWLFEGFIFAAIMPVIISFACLNLVKKFNSTAPGPEYNQLLARSAALQVGFSVLLAIGFFIDSVARSGGAGS